MRGTIFSLTTLVVFICAPQIVFADTGPQATRQAVYEAQSRRYVADRTRRVIPRVASHSQQLVYVDRSTRYDGHVYSGYANHARPRVIHNRAYATPATVTYVQADGDHGTYSQVIDGQSRQVVVVQRNDDSHRYAGYARYKHGRSSSGYGTRARAYTEHRDYHPQVVYQANYHRPVYRNYGHGYGHHYPRVYRHGYYGRHHGHHRAGYGYGCRTGGYGHFGYHRGGHRWHSGVSFHFRF